MSLRSEIAKLVDSIPLADTHEHICEEKMRLGPDAHTDISLLFTHYCDSDLQVVGMCWEDIQKLRSPELSAREKWEMVKPYYQAARNTGYFVASRFTAQKLYGVDDITDDTIQELDRKIKKTVKPGFTRRVLKEVANIDHCQVNSLECSPFCETDLPDVLLQDIGTPCLVNGWSNKDLWNGVGVDVKTIYDYHEVIDRYFEKYAPVATATKNQMAYERRLDYEDVPAEQVETVFGRVATGKCEPTAKARKTMQDHLFHYCVRKATEHNLPVKLHTGYYAGVNSMPLHRLRHNGGDMCELLMKHQAARFVFMHITYPYQSELIAVCKQHGNAYADMCWGWIINPAAATRFLKEFLMAAPATKIFSFGGDYGAVEPVVGHAAVARKGISQVLAELVEEGWMPESEVEYVANRIIRDNAREVFNVKKKFGI